MEVITFSVNPTEERIGYVGSLVISQKLRGKSVFQFCQSESIGISEFFFKSLEGKKTGEDVNVGAYGYGVEVNTKKMKQSKEVALLTADEVEEDIKGGVSEVVTKTDSFEENEKWLEEIDFDKEAFVVTFQMVASQISYEHGQDFVQIINLALKSNRKCITRLSELKDEYSRFDDLVGLLRENKPIPFKYAVYERNNNRKRFRKNNEQLSYEEEETLELERSESLKSKVKPELINRVLNYMENNDFKSMLNTLLDNEELEYEVGIK